MPVNTIAMPCSSAAAITSSSRTCRPAGSRRGAAVGGDVEAVAERKESVRRHHRAGKRQPRVLRLDRGDARSNRRGSSGRRRRRASCRSRAVDDRVGLHELAPRARRTAGRRAALGVGCACVTTLQVGSRRRCDCRASAPAGRRRRACNLVVAHGAPARAAPRARARSALRAITPARRRRRAGAITHLDELRRRPPPRSPRRAARLNAMMPPNADVGSVANALAIGLERCRRDGDAARIGVLDDHAAGSSNCLARTPTRRRRRRCC